MSIKVLVIVGKIMKRVINMAWSKYSKDGFFTTYGCYCTHCWAHSDRPYNFCPHCGKGRNE